jgi:hypothetical protein
MTAVGWFDQQNLQWILGLSLFCGVLVLALPFLDRGGLGRVAVYVVGALALLYLAFVVCRELFA